jgi:hypothetical protein
MSQPTTAMPQREVVYRPFEQKTFREILINFFRREVPHIGGEMIYELVATQIEDFIHDYYPLNSCFQMGQLLWFAVDKNEPGKYGKAMAHTHIKPVILTLVSAADIQNYKNGVALNQIQPQVLARLYQQAYDQGAVLTEADLSLIRHQCLKTISNQTRAYEDEHHVILPRRGTIHDLGRSVSHKAVICKKKRLQQKTISEIALETNHSKEAVSRYLIDLERVEFCLKQKLSIESTSFITNLSTQLVLEYRDLLDELKQQDVPF